ncbi:HAD family hydrolase [Niveibacterium sp. 24ML]|uniref:D-glycero-alpha-D-manno-heptose-1,7-bisphosphate 7-phosphatase n=1 Tax=Niveibacterium sp. 24ML TaxID=2985512 RepID=UPI0022720081|nr:HAD family hydrolase [Niveibacterium sp. 24ML]MCX9156160.1 HAD family hydrolase [Niveibacterium sp. 24ML]
MNHCSALFLDRDGVINEDPGYVHRAEDVRFIPGIFELARAAHARAYRIVVVTNQAGIGRGYFSEAQFDALMQWMRARFDEAGAPLSAVYHCPSHPDHGIGEYRRESPDRKPAPGMLFRARDDLGITLDTSILIGDKLSDTEAGARAGVAHRLLYDPLHSAPDDPHASARIARLTDAIEYLLPPCIPTPAST